ncbi:MAG: metallophosphoesterase family protein, partial [Candidatus Omnitrophica bacterium]|nr:metallophosphoesterase family protein [Candidatus Omnitrophota bacterium]
MRYAIFSDIHGNKEAYGAVLEALKTENLDKCYCAGDIVGYGADPSECISMTKQLNPAIVAGNHDWGATGRTDISNFSPAAKAAVIWTKDALSGSDRDYLKGLKLIYRNDFTM